MGESKHTPGPWEFEADMRVSRIGDMYADSGYSEYLAGWNVYADGAVVVGIEGITPSEEAEANARLIAAAPELLAAIIALRDYAAAEILRGGAHHDPVWRMTADAIAKAEGTPTPNSTTLLSAVSAKGDSK